VREVGVMVTTPTSTGAGAAEEGALEPQADAARSSRAATVPRRRERMLMESENP
jgi:hypothetical protein